MLTYRLTALNLCPDHEMLAGRAECIDGISSLSKASNCMPTRHSYDLIANLVASWVPHTERIMGYEFTTGFRSACDTVIFCRRRWRRRNYKRNTGQAKYCDRCQIS
jgi:hypothetical protein